MKQWEQIQRQKNHNKKIANAKSKFKSGGQAQPKLDTNHQFYNFEKKHM